MNEQNREFDFGSKFEKNPPISEEELLEFQKDINFQLPASYKEFLRASNGGEGFVGVDGYVALWPVEMILRNRLSYEFDKCLPDYIPIGSNGGGEALVIRRRGNSATFGYIPFSDLTENSFIEIDQEFWRTIALIGEGRVFETSH
jgi:hypothetical protein